MDAPSSPRSPPVFPRNRGTLQSSRPVRECSSLSGHSAASVRHRAAWHDWNDVSWPRETMSSPMTAETSSPEAEAEDSSLLTAGRESRRPIAMAALDRIPSGDIISPLQLSPRRTSFSPPLYPRNNRARAASHDVILNINDVLPRFNVELAERIGSITDEDVLSFSQSRSFSTPDRLVGSSARRMTRERANTCPRPQRRVEWEERRGNSRDSLAAYQALDAGSAPLEGSGGDDGIIGGITRSRANACPQDTLEQDVYVNDQNESGAANSTVEQSTQVDATRGQRRPVVSSPLTSSMATTAPPLTITSPARRLNSTPLAPNSPLQVPPTNNNQAIASSALTPFLARPPPRNQSCIFRINHNLMKALMLLSLYMLLAYTWKHDLQFRYKSTEINYGLSEYWNGAIPSPGNARGEKIGRETRKLFNDDADDDFKVKLMKGDTVPTGGGVGSAAGEFSTVEKKKRRPALSHARSISDSSSVMGVTSRRAQRMVVPRGEILSESWWSLSRIAWLFVWMGFTLPIVELGWREMRHQFRVLSLRRLRSLRSSSSLRDL
ncbi:hypothetical protein HJC23_002375 [Cyclotella cryptica]|uniref:Uncharacterized protein n=1 Tax=Cyclotella cryptica TaxID=29204 RepID=A0ABD3QLQ1_9STRA|eukprot:CCRYP_004471-RA/>CCRYP_004471-RA protein AED:0.15 eAED:0.15 QI:219/-1/1/1/-1/1/1/169/550